MGQRITYAYIKVKKKITYFLVQTQQPEELQHYHFRRWQQQLIHLIPLNFQYTLCSHIQQYGSPVRSNISAGHCIKQMKFSGHSLHVLSNKSANPW